MRLGRAFKNMCWLVFMSLKMCKRKLSNEELMKTHEAFGLVTGDTEKDCCNKEAPVLDWIQTFCCEAVIKLKAVSVRFKNISASDVLFKSEINNEHPPAPLYINRSFTDGTKCTGVEFSSAILAGIG
jgi:hypothetical protein